MKFKNLITPSFLSSLCLNKAIEYQSSYIKGRILDIGCGNKPYKKYFAYTEYIGLDTHNSGHNHINTDADIFYDGAIFPFQDNSFDCIVCFQVMEHVSDIDLFINEIRRVLKPGGYMLATAPFMWPEHEKPYDFRRWTSFGFKSNFIAKKFEVINNIKSGNSLIVIVSFINDYFRSKQNSSIKKFLFSIIYFTLNLFCYSLIKLNLIKDNNSNSDFFLDNVIVVKNIL